MFGAALARRIADTAFPQLTAREREVLGLVAAGRSDAQIAAALHLSPETARQRVRRADEAAGHRPGAGHRAGAGGGARALITTGARLVPLSA